MSDRASLFVLFIGFVSGALLLGGLLQATGVVDIIHPLGAKLMYAQYPAPTSPPLNINKIFPELIKNPDLCLSCHDKAQTKGFHVPAKIMKIDESKNLRRRICVDCHGPRGASATEQMSDLDKIKLQSDNISYRLDNSIPHAIHKKKMEIEALKCETCHGGKEGEIIIPLPDVYAGQILVCEKCHVPKDNGNYIAIHVEYGSKTCNTCHTGNLVDIHRKATSKLGIA